MRGTLPASQGSSLLDRLPHIRDLRHCRGRWQPWPAIRGILALAEQNDLPGPEDPNELTVLDGNTVANAQDRVVVNALGVPSRRVHGLEPVRPKEAEDPLARPKPLRRGEGPPPADHGTAPRRGRPSPPNCGWPPADR